MATSRSIQPTEITGSTMSGPVSSTTIDGTVLVLSLTVGIAVGIMILISVIIAIVCCCCVKRKRTRGHVQAQQGQHTAVVVRQQHQYADIPRNQTVQPSAPPPEPSAPPYIPSDEIEMENSEFPPPYPGIV